MATYTDQTIAWNYDPAWSTLPYDAEIMPLEITDGDDDGVIRADGSDLVNGSPVVAVYVGDTITLNGQTITGVTFYTEDGGRFFTPNDGTILRAGIITEQTFVTDSTAFAVGDLGPPCFGAGTRLAVPGGQAAVETLVPGDLVLTRDRGAQPVRWVGRRRVPGTGDFAPVRIAAGALGDHGTLSVSPQHRILLGDWRAQVYLGEDEALCPAHMLVDDARVRRAPCPEVTYVHLMFDAHEIVFAEGLPCESFLFGDYLCHGSSALRAELLALFPHLGVGRVPMQAARRSLKRHEGALLAAARRGGSPEGAAAAAAARAPRVSEAARPARTPSRPGRAG